VDVDTNKIKKEIESKKAELSINEFKKFLLSEIRRIKKEAKESRLPKYSLKRVTKRYEVLKKYLDNDAEFILDISGFDNFDDPYGTLVRVDESTIIPLYKNIAKILKKYDRTNQEAVSLLIAYKEMFPIWFIKDELKPLIAHLQTMGDKKLSSKPFPGYLLHKRRELLAKEIKNEFNTEIGKEIRLLIEALIVSNPPLLTIENRKRKAIYNALKEYLNRNIGSYQSIFDYKFDPKTDELDFDSINTKLQFILTKINS